MSSSMPSSREMPSEPFGSPSFRPEALALARIARAKIIGPAQPGAERQDDDHSIAAAAALGPAGRRQQMEHRRVVERLRPLP